MSSMHNIPATFRLNVRVHSACCLLTSCRKKLAPPTAESSKSYEVKRKPAQSWSQLEKKQIVSTSIEEVWFLCHRTRCAPH